VRTYRKRTPNRRHIPRQQPKLGKAINWIRQIADGPYYIVLTRTWTQEERDKFIVRNRLVQIFHPEHDLDITRGILIRELPYFLKTGDDYKREQRLGGLGTAHQGSCSHK